MTSVREQIIQTRNGAVKTRVAIGGEGPPVVHLHGLEGLHWSELHDGLAADHTVYAIEHVGSGESTGIEELYDFWDLVGHYEEAFDELGLTSTALVGHSFGGMVAAEVAAHLRARVTSLALLAPLGLWDDRHPVAEIDAIARADRPSRLLADPTRPLPGLLAPDVTDHEALFHADLNAASINQFSWPIAEKGLARRLYRITAPTLLLWGAEDRIVDPVYAELFRARLTAATTVSVLPRIGHLLHLEDPGAVLEQVRAHLRT
ncbi:alpha/beta fold hydrolase [Pseudonocardia sp. GCM10023141]|uniref:alpha/beta fold hydrolase n=1 Tax=Pseudonocardia sp. GCM10023141 TaxID=3252653 RepID=UPI00360BF8E4